MSNKNELTLKTLFLLLKLLNKKRGRKPKKPASDSVNDKQAHK